MTGVSEDKVLRVNCPGFGTSAIMPLGEAKPLAMYEVIVVNPISVLHMFENASDVVKQIEMLQADGMTSYRYETDAPLQNIQAEMDIRQGELTAFLKKGGLLIVFLAPPFTVSGPEVHMDNYTWLGDWCPDKPSSPNQRNMSATIRGKTIDTSADAAQSIWVPYLKQAGLEWSTIIRLDNLTEGVVPLATAGLNKIVAGFKSSGPKAGQVVFLPAPYGTEYDAKLKECIDKWFKLHIDDSPGSAGLQDLSKGLSSLLNEEEKDEAKMAGAAKSAAFDSKPEPAAAASGGNNNNDGHASAKKPEAPQFFDKKEAGAEEGPPPLPTMAKPEIKPVPKPEPRPEPKPEAKVEPKPEAKPEPKPEAKPEPVAEVKNKEPEPEPKVEPVAQKEQDPKDQGNDQEADNLIKKMQKNVSQNSVPEWCSKFSFDELEGLRRQHENVEEQIRLAQIKAKELEERIELMEELKNTLLSADGDLLADAVGRIFTRLGWTVKKAMGAGEELWLTDDEKTQAIVRLHYSTTQPNRAELAALAESVITYWGAHEVEPKGILVSSTYADKPLQERPDEEFPDSMHDFAKRKNLCLLTTCQLLAIFRDLEITQSSPKTIRENILTTSGRVPEYQFNKKGASSPAKR